MQERKTTDIFVNSLRALRKPNTLSEKEAIGYAVIVLQALGCTEEEAKLKALDFIKEVQDNFFPKEDGNE